jgi:hypothetical protein
VAWWVVSYAGSYPSAPGSARLNLARLATDDLAGGPTVRTWHLTGRWHDMPTVHDDVTITSGWCHPYMPTVHADITITSCWRHQYHGQSHGSGQLVFGSGQPIRVKKTCGTRGARLCAWTATSSLCGGACVHVRRLILMPFSPVASSLPPLHNGMFKTQFWQLLFLSKNQTPIQTISSDTNCMKFRSVMFWYLLIRG